MATAVDRVVASGGRTVIHESRQRGSRAPKDRVSPFIPPGMARAEAPANKTSSRRRNLEGVADEQSRGGWQVSVMNVRPYREEDAEPLMRLYFDTVRRVNGRDYSPRQIEAWAPSRAMQPDWWRERFARKHPLVAIDGESPIGFAELNADGLIDCFYVHYAWQGRGVGHALMDGLFTEARRLGITYLRSEVSVTARAFFERHGFWVLRVQELEVQGQRLEICVMERTLAAVRMRAFG